LLARINSLANAEDPGSEFAHGLMPGAFRYDIRPEFKQPFERVGYRKTPGCLDLRPVELPRPHQYAG